MGDKIQDQLDRIRRYEDLIQKQTGKAIRPYRADGYVNLLNRYGTEKDTSEQYHFQPEPMVDDRWLTEFYEGNGLFAKIIDAPAEEAVKHGFTLGDIKDQNVLDFCYEALDELDWEETAITALRWARLFGGSIVVMLINDGRGIDEPLDWKNIQSIDDLRVYDRSVIQPDYQSMFSYNPEDPFRTRGSRLGMPEYYHVFSKYGSFIVHESRCLVFRNGVLPENCSTVEYELWGMPEYIRLQRAIRDTELAHSNGPKMLEKSVQAVYKMRDLAAELATEDGENRVLRRLQIIDMARGLLNSIAIDNENEDYDFRTFQFSGVSEIIDTTCNFLSALSSIPQTVLFGRSPAGMNATGEGDMENYYNFVGRIQKRMLKSNLRYMLSIVFQAGVATGEIVEIPKIKPEFNALWSLSELEQAQLENQKASTQQVKANTAQLYVDMGAIDPSEVRAKLAESEDFDVENMLDDYTDEDLFANYNETAEGEENAEEPEDGNSSEAAPAATKLPQDMTEEERLQKAAEGTSAGQNEDGTQNPTGDSKRGAVGVLVVKNGKILCGTRKGDYGYGLICGPGGHVENCEMLPMAALRETYEEFNIYPKDLICIGENPEEPETCLISTVFLCTDYDGEPVCDGVEMTDARFLTLSELEELSPSLFQPFKDSLKLLSDCIKTEETNSIISEKPIDKSAKTVIIKSKDSQKDHADYGVPGMKWGEHKQEESEEGSSGDHKAEKDRPEDQKEKKQPDNSEGKVKKTKVTKFKTKNGVMTVSSDTKAKLGSSGGTKIMAGEITDVEPFAGKGSKKPFDLAKEFANTYGGNPSDWSHSKGVGKIKLSDGTEKQAEIHWFECEGVGQTKWKIKKFKKG